MSDDPQYEFQKERARLQQRELGRADPSRHIINAENCGHAHGTPVRDSHERLALTEAMMLVAHRLGELTRILARGKNTTPSENGTAPHE